MMKIYITCLKSCKYQAFLAALDHVVEMVWNEKFSSSSNHGGRQYFVIGSPPDLFSFLRASTIIQYFSPEIEKKHLEESHIIKQHNLKGVGPPYCLKNINRLIFHFRPLLEGKQALMQAVFHVGDRFRVWENWHPKNWKQVFHRISPIL